jgi:hypothetical protein
MKGKTIGILLISATMTAVTLTGCNSNDKTLTSKNETVTEEAPTTEVETATTAEETSTIEETTTESETTTTEVETSTIEETTTEEEISTAEKAVTDTVVKNGITFATDVDSDDMQLTIDACTANIIVESDLDINEDGIIDKDEAALLKKYFTAEDIQRELDDINKDKARHASEQANSSTTTPSTSSTTSTLEEREDKTDPNNFTVFDQGDYSKADKNGYVY